MASKQLSLKRLSMPIFLEMFLRYISIIINTIMVSQYSNFLVGAMGAGNQIINLCFIIFTFLSTGCSIVIAQSIGAKNNVLAKKAINQSIFLNAFLGFFCAILILSQGDFLLTLLNIPNDLLKDSSIYLKMLGICLFFDSIGIILAALIRVYNKAYFVMATILCMNIIILIGNFYVLHYTKMELFGIGISNVVGRAFALLMLLFILIFKLNIRLELKEMIKLEKDVLKKIFNIGGFAAGENVVWLVQYVIAFSFVATLGKESVSVQTIYFQISLLIMLIGEAVSVANEIIIGKLVGAKQFNIAYKHTWIALYFSVIASALIALLNFALKDWTMDLVGLQDALKTIMTPLFALSIFLEIARTFNIIMVNALRASGDARFPFLSGVVFMLGVSLPVGYILCFNFNLGIVGVWIGFCADEFLRGIANSYRWKSKKWQNKSVV